MGVVASQSKKGCETKGLSNGKGSFDSFVKKCLICMLTRSVKDEANAVTCEIFFQIINEIQFLQHVISMVMA